MDKLGHPTGQALDYNGILKAFKTDINEDFPDLDSTEYGLHSFRRFGATYAKAKGIPDDLVQHMGGCAALDCFKTYWLFSEEEKVDINRGLLI